MTVDEKIHEATVRVLIFTHGIGAENFDAMEIFLRALMSVALDASDGENKKVVEWIDLWLLPNITNIRDQLEKEGGISLPEYTDPTRLN